MPKNIAVSLQAVPPKPAARLDAARILAALPQAIVAVDRTLAIRYANAQAEEFFRVSATAMRDMPLTGMISQDSPVFGLVAQVFENASPVAEHDLVIDDWRAGRRDVSLQATPLGDPVELAVLAFQERSIADKLGQQWNRRGAAQSVRAMSAMLAHEVRNPLAGIRGAAQLIEQGASDSDKELTRLICDETDRIKSLVDRMEIFSDDPLAREAVNIHDVLEQVRKVASAAFARHAVFTEHYDPSLPPVLGNREQLIRIFTNLVKNAAEAIAHGHGEITLTTAYQSGFRIAQGGGSGRSHLPLVVTVEDNGEGIPDAIRPHLFEAFVSGKQSGTGLGLALVAKLVGDHGGLIDVETPPGRTIFRVYLPMAEAVEGEGE